MTSAGRDGRIPVLYLAPWVDLGGSDKSTIDWFRCLDRERFAPSIVTTQPSRNRRLRELSPYAEEVWSLPDLVAGGEMAPFILDFLATREVEVLHVMNSRLGFELLPDLSALPDKPKVVVQLHVEEPDRSGYVRYVTTRYGNLVDRFSVTSEHLAQTVYDYGVSRDRISVIFTGVDAEDEFNPGHAPAEPELTAGHFHILYPGRIVAQKDPLMMVEVATALRELTADFRLHVVGEGDLEADVRRQVTARGLGGHVLFHPSTDRLQGWYAACDALLMTSVFEGVPVVVYEAMAMELPVVAPALPGNVELLGDTAGGLISPRDDAAAYAATLAGLARDTEGRAELARRARDRIREEFSLERMGSEHGELYLELLEGDPRSATVSEPAPPDARVPEPPPVSRFLNRRLFDTPLVSVIIPCFNQGRVLLECLDAVRAQTHPRIETIVVDDASTERETRAVMDGLSSDGDLSVIRLDENGGPSRARNAALDRCSGRYVLPVDSDNLLLPDAVERLVAQLKVAGETVGFVYPNVSYFGNRDDYFEAPDWDLYGLLHRNVCDVCSLFDREIFDAGARFDETIRLGHEDWEFVLRLAAGGIRGEPAHGPVLRYRVWGFNRSESVEHAADSFEEAVRRRSPLAARERELKAQWSPALSLTGLTPFEALSTTGEKVVRLLAAQTCSDLELIARVDRELPQNGGPPARRLPPAVSLSDADAVVHAHASAKGRLFALTRGTGAELLADPTFLEKALRVLRSAQAHGSPLEALVFSDAGAEAGPDWSFIDRAADVSGAHTVIMTRAVVAELGAIAIDALDPVRSLVEACVAVGPVGWRHLPALDAVRTTRDVPDRRASRPAVLGSSEPRTPGARALFEEREQREPLIPGLRPGSVRRWKTLVTWAPPLSRPLCRHRKLGGERRIVTRSRESPPGYGLEFDLGSTRVQSLVGTRRLVKLAGGDFTTFAAGERGGAGPGAGEARPLGYIEEAPLPLLESLVAATYPPTGQRILVAGESDPLASVVENGTTLGFIEPLPVYPRRPAHAECTLGLVPLFRAVDRGARRHRYGAGSIPAGELVGELGAMLSTPQADCVPVWIEDDRLTTDRHRVGRSRPHARSAVRWAAAPLAWRGFSEPMPRARAAARRTLTAAAALSRPASRPAETGAEPVGWLLGRPVRESLPLYASYHPVTRDQLLTTQARFATDLGYGEPELLGHLRAVAPMTGRLDLRKVGIPWASRFALTVEPR